MFKQVGEFWNQACNVYRYFCWLDVLTFMLSTSSFFLSFRRSAVLGSRVVVSATSLLRVTLIENIDEVGSSKALEVGPSGLQCGVSMPIPAWGRVDRR